jgi:hypothetical protein
VLAVAREAGLGAEQHRARDDAQVREQRFERGAVPRGQALVGVDVEDPVAARGVQRGVARGREVVGPAVIDQAGAVLERDRARPVDRTGVRDDDLVDASGERREAAREEALLVADDERGGDSGADGSAKLARAGRPRAVNPGRGSCGRDGGGA